MFLFAFFYRCGIMYAIICKGGVSVKRNKGFTLMELLIVVAVITVLAAVATPTFIQQKAYAEAKSDVQAVSAVYTQMQSNYAIYGKADSKIVPEKMNQDFASEIDSNNELAGLDNIFWKKGDTVTISVDKDGRFSWACSQ